MQSALENFGKLMSGEYPDDTIVMPVDVVVNLALWSSVSLSRALHEKLKAARDGKR